MHRRLRGLRRVLSPAVIDWLVAGACLVLGLVTQAAGNASTTVPRLVVGSVLVGVASAALLWRRRRPLAAFAVIWLACAGYVAARLPPANLDMVAVVAVYSVAAYGPGVAALSVSLAATVLLVALNLALQHSALATIASISNFWVIFLIGRAAQAHRRQAALVEARRAEQDRRAVAEERARAAERQAELARELHDILSQSLAVVAVQAGGAAGLGEGEAAEMRTALAQVAAVARDGLDQTRVLLHRMRDGVRTMPAAQEDLGALVASFRAHGLPVEARLDRPCASVRPAVPATVYRVVREALTNVLKHAPGARTVVTVRYGDEAAEVTVHDTGTSTVDKCGPLPSAGVGLSGLRERVLDEGGRFRAGAAGGGFEVHAVLPLSGGSR